MNNILDVYFNTTLAGHLYYDKILTFIYDKSYIKSDNMALSFALPKRIEAYQGDEIEPFFQGLLPDEGVKQAVARYLKTDKNNTFRLLSGIAGDCAGAISLFPHGMRPQNYDNPKYEKLSDTAVLSILTNLKKRPLYVGGDDFRVSGAGAQDKLMISIVDNNINLPLHGTPSTHIIKPDILGFIDTTYNELFCMKLANMCDLSTPACFIKKIDDIPFYVVERYDRIIIDNHITRQHQEDFCQALQILPQNKYESDGGPGYKDCFDLLDKIGVDVNSKIAFLNLVIFNYLIGNGDAHGKNFSILYENNAPILAPCYDLMCTAVLYDYYPKITMAMRLNSKKYLMERVSRQKFADFAPFSGFKADFILNQVDKMCLKIKQNAPQLAQTLNADPLTKSAEYDKIIAIITKHIDKITNF